MTHRDQIFDSKMRWDLSRPRYDTSALDNDNYSTIHEISNRLSARDLVVKIIPKKNRQYIIFPENAWDVFSPTDTQIITHILEVCGCLNIGHDEDWERLISFSL